ncbi:hypothetical protein HNP33_001654 [Comamonas odontotermitis]|uniref:Uncharacterized protein n=1 Tax=Comamonas odontotermitis TaxID=379895 RepID=A0ABR6REK8_9BURK|nr:hypothetical protein [Comamonas odontotermitis]
MSANNASINDEAEHVATLVYPDEYSKNVNQVASVSSERILFVKRKELAMTPYELLQFPTSSLTSVRYKKRLAIWPMLIGAIFVTLVLFILTSEVAPGTRVPVGALALLLVLGGGLFLGPRRHQLTFEVNGKTLRWQSKAGDFKYKVASSQKVVDWARTRGILRER